MAKQTPLHELHFIFIPLLAPGHMIPMIDMARLFAKRGVQSSIFTTALNAARFKATIDTDTESGLPIQLLELNFPYQQVGMPHGIENVDALFGANVAWEFFDALELLQAQTEQLLQQLPLPPSCIISDSLLPWTHETARKFQIPRLVFHGMCCFSLLCYRNVHRFKSYESIVSETEPVAIPGLPHQIDIPKVQLPAGLADNSEFDRRCDKSRAADLEAYGIVVNSFGGLEKEYVEHFQEAMGVKVWTLGPVSLCNKQVADMVKRGSKSSIHEHVCLSWLDSRKPKSVLYVCFGSLSRFSLSQMKEIGLGLEASNRPFIWVVRGVVNPTETEKWLTEEFEERIKDRCLLIRGWAPQLLILSHPAIGGFVTHCGWNSTLEGICSGVPMLAWPLFGEQFFNEKLIVKVLRIAVDLGVFRGAVQWNPDEKVDFLVKMEVVKEAIDKLMDDGSEGEERRNRAREFGEKAKKAMEEGGSSYFNMTLLIEDIMHHARESVNSIKT